MYSAVLPGAKPMGAKARMPTTVPPNSGHGAHGRARITAYYNAISFERRLSFVPSGSIGASLVECETECGITTSRFFNWANWLDQSKVSGRWKPGLAVSEGAV